MAIAVSLLDYTPGMRNSTLYFGLSFSGNYTTGGDTLNLESPANSTGLEVEGLFETPMSGGPGIFFESLDGYYLQPVVTGVSSPSSYRLQVFTPGGTELAAGSYPSAVVNGNAVLIATKRSV
jgi:hypothetical protein